VHRELLSPCPDGSARCWSLVDRGECSLADDPPRSSPIVANDPGRRRGLEIECVVDD
jgi:hypothetical protein